jgi:hypothetical protein
MERIRIQGLIPGQWADDISKNPEENGAYQRQTVTYRPHPSPKRGEGKTILQRKLAVLFTELVEFFYTSLNLYECRSSKGIWNLSNNEKCTFSFYRLPNCVTFSKTGHLLFLQRPWSYRLQAWHPF